MQAVITADIVNSTKLDGEAFQRLVMEIEQLYPGPNRIEFYRGDSFQALVEDGASAYKTALQSRLKAISFSDEERIDIRLSISLGKVRNEIAHMGSHIESIFVNSGRTFDQFSDHESGRLLLITTGKDKYDFSYDLIARYTDSLLSQVSAKQATALYHLFSGKSQKEAAGLLRKSVSTINQQVKTARFDELEVLLKNYETLTKAIADGN